MREISRAEQDLISSALRRLAAASPREAPSEVADSLRHAFRQVHARRRRKRLLEVAGIAACFVAVLSVGVAGKFYFGVNHGYATHNRTAAARIPAATPAIEGGVAESASAGLPQATSTDAETASLDAQRFVPLPSFDPDVPVGDSEVLRVEMPASALQLVGIPVSEQASDEPLLADILVAQDGRPYAVRVAAAH